MVENDNSEARNDELNTSSISNDQLDRRTLLRLTGASTVTGALGSMAGCQGDQEPEDGADQTDQDTDSPTPAENLESLPELNFVTWSQSERPDLFEATRLVQASLEELGIESSLDPQQFPQPFISTMFETREFDLNYLELIGNAFRLDPSFYLNTVLHSKNIPVGGWNFTGYENEEFDTLSDQQQSTLDNEERQEIVYQLQEIAHEEQAWTITNSPFVSTALNVDRLKPPSEAAPGERLMGIFQLVTIEGREGNTTARYGINKNQINTFNPLEVTESQDIRLFRPFYDALLRVGPTGRPVKWNIDNLEVVDDTTVTATLMDDLTFHDGEPLDAEDVVFSYEYQKEHESQYVFSFLEPIDSVTSDDDKTVTFNLAEPYAPFQMLTMAQVPIIPKHIWEGIENPRDERNVPAIGSGPFKFGDYEPGSFLEYTAFEDHPRAPKIEKLQIQLFGSKSSVKEALTQGQIDGMSDIPASLLPDLESNESIEVQFRPSHGFEAVLVNERRGMPFKDEAFRRALSYAIPRKAIADQIYDGNSSSNEGSIIVSANEFWHNPDIDASPYDLDEARSILRQAGYDWDDAGTLMYPSE